LEPAAGFAEEEDEELVNTLTGGTAAAAGVGATAAGAEAGALASIALPLPAASLLTGEGAKLAAPPPPVSAEEGAGGMALSPLTSYFLTVEGGGGESLRFVACRWRFGVRCLKV